MCDENAITVKPINLENAELVRLTKCVVIKEVIPLNQPLSHIKTFEDFCKICIFPFISINSRNNNDTTKEIDIQGRVSSLINKTSIHFLDKKVNVKLVNISERAFRLILTDGIS